MTRLHHSALQLFSLCLFYRCIFVFATPAHDTDDSQDKLGPTVNVNMLHVISLLFLTLSARESFNKSISLPCMHSSETPPIYNNWKTPGERLSIMPCCSQVRLRRLIYNKTYLKPQQMVSECICVETSKVKCCTI